MPMYELTPSQIMKEVIHCISRGKVPLIRSSPGLGKSSIIAQIARDFNLWLIDLRLSMCTPEDFMGLPFRKDNKASFMSFDTFPVEGDPIPKGYDGFLLFLDEVNSVGKAMEAAAYKVILDRMVGQAKLHPKCAVVCAGNHDTDGAITNTLGTASQSRLIHLNMRASSEEFEVYSQKQNFDPRVTAFIQHAPTKLHKFNPDHSDYTYACPRTWEFVSDLIKDVKNENISMPLLAGTIGEGMAVEFNTFLQEFSKLPKFQDIVARPESTVVPSGTATQYALTALLMEKTDRDNFEKVVIYAKRMAAELRAVYFRGVVFRDPGIRKTDAFLDNLQELQEYIYDTSSESNAFATKAA